VELVRVYPTSRILKSVTDMRDLAEQLQTKLGSAWPRIVAWLRDNNNLSEVQRRIEIGDYEGALTGITDAAAWFSTEVGAATKYAAQSAAKVIDTNLDRLITFDETNYRAVRAMEGARTDLLVQVSNDQRNTVRSTIAEGLARGENPRVIAGDVRMSIGLTDSQRQYVTNFRRELENGQWTQAMGRELADGRWQRTFERLSRDGGTLTDSQITAMTNKYSDNWVAFRAENIARTEGLRAAHVGSHAMYEQAIEAGKLSADELERTWRHGPKRKHSRAGHVSMNNQKRMWGEAFLNPLTGNTLMHPLDPEAPVGETASCTCIEIVRIVPRKR
jgi:hypothetical protein